MMCPLRIALYLPISTCVLKVPYIMGLYSHNMRESFLIYCETLVPQYMGLMFRICFHPIDKEFGFTFYLSAHVFKCYLLCPGA